MFLKTLYGFTGVHFVPCVIRTCDQQLEFVHQKAPDLVQICVLDKDSYVTGTGLCLMPPRHSVQSVTYIVAHFE